jgi:5-methylthioribose kinase
MNRDPLPSGAYYLDPADAAGFSAFAQRRGWLTEDEAVVSFQKAGEGNMNCTLRARTKTRTFIVKQGRPWVEKYATIAAPWGRTAVEAAFYECAAADPALCKAMPRMIACDPGSQLLLLEDLGDASDYLDIYSDRALSGAEVHDLIGLLCRLHRLLAPDSRRPAFTNRAMRALNHEHIFRLPLARGNGIDLDAYVPGLDEAAARLKADVRYCLEVERLGCVYLEDGPTLLHGDFYPGSWLRAPRGVCVIDPEFCFLGRAEFDVGVMFAHLLLADVPAGTAEGIFTLYQPSGGFDRILARRFAGTEIMRRILGMARLPIPKDLKRLSDLLARSHALVCESC